MLFDLNTNSQIKAAFLTQTSLITTSIFLVFLCKKIFEYGFLTKQVLNEAFGNLSFGKTSELEKIS
jgi:hypothetical protein